MIVYVDTSAALKLLFDEEETRAAEGWFAERAHGTPLVASFLLSTELRCAAVRRSPYVDLGAVDRILEAVDLTELLRRDLLTAPRMPGALRTNDAIHLAVAIRLGVDAMLTYDAELASAAGRVGIEVLAPV